MSQLSYPTSSGVPAVHVNDLPVEILHKIFINTYPRIMTKPEDTILFPRRLSHVCKYWRGAAFSYCEMWSYLALTLDQEFTVNHGKIREMFNEFLERTKKAPINFLFHFSFDQPLDEKARVSLEGMTLSLLERQSRWKVVNFIWRGLQLSRHSRKLIIEDTPILQSLYLNVSLYSDNGEDYPVKLNIDGSLPIQSIHLDGNYRLDIIPKAAGASESLQRLTTLSLKYGNGISPPSGTVLERLSLPELEGLEYWDDRSEFDGSSILDLIERSHPRITTLSLRTPRIQDVIIIDILRLLPTLVNLDLLTYPVTTGLMSALNVYRGPGPPSIDPKECAPIVCPMLRTLQLSGMQPNINDAENPVVSLMLMIASRSIEKGTLNEAVLYTAGECNEVSFAHRDYTPLMSCFCQGGDIFVYTEDEGEDEDEEEEEEEEEEEGDD